MLKKACSSRVPWLRSQHPCGDSQVSVTTIPWNSMPSSSLASKNTHRCTINLNKSLYKIHRPLLISPDLIFSRCPAFPLLLPLPFSTLSISLPLLLQSLPYPPFLSVSRCIHCLLSLEPYSWLVLIFTYSKY